MNLEHKLNNLAKKIITIRFMSIIIIAVMVSSIFAAFLYKDVDTSQTGSKEIYLIIDFGNNQKYPFNVKFDNESAFNILRKQAYVKFDEEKKLIDCIGGLCNTNESSWKFLTIFSENASAFDYYPAESDVLMFSFKSNNETTSAAKSDVPGLPTGDINIQ